MNENLGVKTDRFILVDWLTFTVGTLCFLDDADGDGAVFIGDSILRRAKQFLGIEDDVEFIYQETRLYGYRYMYKCGGIKICFGGSDAIMFDFSGEGCRLLETLNSEFDWLELILRISTYRRHNFSRLDIACDTFGMLKMPLLARYALHGRYVSRWKSAPRVVQGREETIDFGSPQSRNMLRIYNKTLERQCKLKAEDLEKGIEIPSDWVRCELQLRNEAVDSFIREWVAKQDISTVYFGIMSNQLRFVKERPKQETNLSRLEVVAWWRRFLDNSKPIKLAYKGGLAYNLESLEKYVYGQASSSIKTWLIANDWDVDKMISMVSERELNDKQQALLHTVSAVKNSDV